MAAKFFLFASLCFFAVRTEAPTDPILPVTVDNFARAESDRYFASRVDQGGFGKLYHMREPLPVEHQSVIRGNRDTLYSSGVFDLNAGPVLITMPDAGDRYMSIVAIDQDAYCTSLKYEPNTYVFDNDEINTRYVMIGIRTMFDPTDPTDIKHARALQDAIEVRLVNGPGEFEVPKWDQQSLDKVRTALLTLASTLPDSRKMFGSRRQVDPVRHLIGAAFGWGGNHEKDALYLNFYPKMNDGKTAYKLTVKDVPVDAFWSVSVYNARGYFEPNAADAYSVNNLSAKKSEDGSFTIQFGGNPSQDVNHLPTMPGWSYLVRLYRPRDEILNGSWTFPAAQAVP